MCVIEVDEYCEVWKETNRKARKPHKCSCCYRTIAKGETYLIHFSLFEGDVTTAKLCSNCELDRKDFGDAHKVTPNPMSFYEDLVSCVHDDEDDDEDANKWLPMLNRIKAERNKRRELP